MRTRKRERGGAVVSSFHCSRGKGWRRRLWYFVPLTRLLDPFFLFLVSFSFFPNLFVPPRSQAATAAS